MSNLATRVEKLERNTVINDGKPMNITVRFLGKESEKNELYCLYTDISSMTHSYLRNDDESEKDFVKRAFEEHRLKTNMKEHEVAVLFQREQSN